MSRKAAVAIEVAPVEARLRPPPFVQGDAGIVIDVEAIEERSGRLRIAQDFSARQHAIAVAIQPLKGVPGPVPFATGDTAIVIVVESVEPIVAVVIPGSLLAEELGAAHDAVTIPIDTPERFPVVVPLVFVDSVVAVAIEAAEGFRCPGGDLRLLPGCKVIVPRAPPPTASTGPHLVAGENAIVIPVVAAEGLVAAAPFRSSDGAVAISIHPLEPTRIRLRLCSSRCENTEGKNAPKRPTDEL